jgi:hypothetical protein
MIDDCRLRNPHPAATIATNGTKFVFNPQSKSAIRNPQPEATQLGSIIKTSPSTLLHLPQHTRMPASAVADHEPSSVSTTGTAGSKPGRPTKRQCIMRNYTGMLQPGETFTAEDLARRADTTEHIAGTWISRQLHTGLLTRASASHRLAPGNRILYQFQPPKEPPMTTVQDMLYQLGGLPASPPLPIAPGGTWFWSIPSTDRQPTACPPSPTTPATARC